METKIISNYNIEALGNIADAAASVQGSANIFAGFGYNTFSFKETNFYFLGVYV